MRTHWRFWALTLCLLGLPATTLAQTQPSTVTVATCAPAASGTSFGTAWLPCVSTVSYVAVSQIKPTTIVADLRCPSGGACAAQWLLASAIQSGDQVWTGTAAGVGSQWVAATTLSLPPTAIPAPPVVVTGVATLTWLDPTLNTDGSPLTDLASVNVYRAANCTGFSLIASVKVPLTTYTDAGLPQGAYCYTLSAVSTSEGEGPHSTPMHYPTPSAPSSIAVTPVTVATTVYMEQQVPNGFSFLAVGTVPLNTPCDPTQRVNNFNVVPASAVTWTGNIHRLAALAACSVN